MNLTYCRTLTEKRIDIGYLIDFRTYLYQLEEGTSYRVNVFKNFKYSQLFCICNIFLWFHFSYNIYCEINWLLWSSKNVRIVRWFACAIYSEMKGRNTYVFGAFNNYVDQIFTFFDPLPYPPAWTVFISWAWTKTDIFDHFPPHLVHVVVECPLICSCNDCMTWKVTILILDIRT